MHYKWFGKAKNCRQQKLGKEKVHALLHQIWMLLLELMQQSCGNFSFFL